jgi:hypothetical protein
MARGNNQKLSASARSELRMFQDTKVTRGGFDNNTDQEFESRRDARLTGESFGNFEEEAKTTTYSAFKIYEAYKERGIYVKTLIDQLPSKELKQYEKFRKIAVKAYDEADEKLKADFKLKYPDKEYTSIQRGKIVANALKEARNALQEKENLQKFKLKSNFLPQKPSELASLALTRLIYEKDDFLRDKGYYARLPFTTHLEVDLIDGSEIDYIESKKK